MVADPERPTFYELSVSGDSLCAQIVRGCKHGDLIGAFAKQDKCGKCGYPLAQALRDMGHEPGLGAARLSAASVLIAGYGAPAPSGILSKLDLIVMRAQRDESNERDFRETHTWLQKEHGVTPAKRRLKALARNVRKLEPRLHDEYEMLTIIGLVGDGDELSPDGWAAWLRTFEVVARFLEDVGYPRGRPGRSKDRTSASMRTAIVELLRTEAPAIPAHHVIKVCHEAVFGKRLKDPKAAAKRARRRARSG